MSKEELPNREVDRSPINYPRYFVTGQEYMDSMRVIGVNVREFADHIGKSENFIRQGLGDRIFEPVPIKYVEALELKVGRDVFEAALARIRSKVENRRYYEDLADRYVRDFRT